MKPEPVHIEAKRYWNTEGGRWSARIINNERKIKFGFLPNTNTNLEYQELYREEEQQSRDSIVENNI